MIQPTRTDRVATNAGEVHIARFGDGAPVVLLHATLHDYHDFDLVIPTLAQEYSVIAIDWPAHGQSGPLPAGIQAGGSLFADVLREVLSALRLPPAVFIGNSVGGFAAARLAISDPHSVAGLVLSNSAGFAQQTLVTGVFCRLLGIPLVSRAVLPRLIPAYMKPSSENDERITAKAVARSRTKEGAQVAASLWRSFTDPDYDLRSRADKITVPTLLTWGTKDPILPLAAGQATHSAVADSRLETYPTGHVVFSSTPDQFLSATVPFLQTTFAMRK